MNMKSAEDLANILGNPGRCQVIICVMLAASYLFICWGHLGMAFYAAETNHHCFVQNKTNIEDLIPVVDDKGKEVLDSCHLYAGPNRTKKSQCTNGWTYNLPDRERTIIAEWDLVCDDAYKSNLATVLYFCGVLLGALVFGGLSDRFGRRPVLLFTMYSPVIVGLIIFFTNNYVVFVIFRFILGFLLEGLQITTFTMIVELVGKQNRTTVTVLSSSLPWSIGIMTLSLISYVIQNWKYIQLFTTLCMLLQFYLLCFLPESLRWFLVRKRVQDAEVVVSKIAKFNNLEFPRELFDQVANDSSKGVENDPTSTINYTIFDIFRSPLLRKRWAITIFLWFSMSLSYYGLALNVSRLAGNKYLNFFVSGVSEVVINILTVFALTRYGRKKPSILYFIVGGITCIIAGALPKDKESLGTLTTSLALFGRICIAGNFSIMFIYTSELYPTVIRNIGLGAGIFGARIGNILAPQILLLGSYTADSVPFIIFGVCVLLAGLLVMLLPETLHRKLAETIEEVENQPMIKGKLSSAESYSSQEENKESEVKTTTDL